MFVFNVQAIYLDSMISLCEPKSFGHKKCQHVLQDAAADDDAVTLIQTASFSGTSLKNKVCYNQTMSQCGNKDPMSYVEEKAYAETVIRAALPSG